MLGSGTLGWWQMLAVLLLALMTVWSAPASASSGQVRGGNVLSKRTQLRYEDVLTTKDGTRWRGKLVAEGEVYRIRLDGGSEVAVAQADVASVTRELIPGFPHTGLWGVRAGLGGEALVVASEQNAGFTYGGLLELAVTHNFRGAFEPEVALLLSPMSPVDGQYSWQLAIATRYYLSANRRTKPYTYTQVVIYGRNGDLGLRTGPGFMLDISPGFGIAVNQGVTLMTQSLNASNSSGFSTGVGYHVLLTGQGRF